jgi:hypothetical protein
VAEKKSVCGNDWDMRSYRIFLILSMIAAAVYQINKRFEFGSLDVGNNFSTIIGMRKIME